jgi:predicted nucleotidyltransferase
LTFLAFLCTLPYEIQAISIPVEQMALDVHDMNQKMIRFFEGRPEIIAVYLFGSRARSYAKETSDVDLAILVDPEAKVDEIELKQDLRLCLSGVLRKEIHLVLLNHAGETLSAQVFKHGRCLYNSKPRVLSAFKTVQFSKIADFAYLRNAMEKGFTRKVMEGDH